MYLYTERGDYVARRAIVRIGPLNTRPTRAWHEIDYTVGNEPRSTTASAEAVRQFFEDLP